MQGHESTWGDLLRTCERVAVAETRFEVPKIWVNAILERSLIWSRRLEKPLFRVT